ncbi:MAG: DUF2293 domain-containing protein [Acidobacteria bacterium]|nr:DUF2293 domain-containing protein [Acidobacteriota bacterium]
MPGRDAGERVRAAAEQALDRQKYVSAIDVLVGMNLLSPRDLEGWRRGQIPQLERVVHCNLNKLSEAMKLLRQWASERGLKPSETVYMTQGRGGTRRPLQFSVSGDEDIERAYRTHYVSTELSEKKQQKLLEKASAPKEIVAFLILHNSKCSECGEELPRTSFLTMEGSAPLCLACADLGHLVYLPSGDAALTRRAGKYSALRAVVVRFSRARGRYERQGLLVEQAALEQAEEECLEDEEVRLRRRLRDAERRTVEDTALAGRMTERILELYPRCPPGEARAIARHTAERGSGRVGRSAAGRALDEEALRLAVTAAIRHNHTEYDTLLMQGADRLDARKTVRDRVTNVLTEWGPGTACKVPDA